MENKIKIGIIVLVIIALAFIGGFWILNNLQKSLVSPQLTPAASPLEAKLSLSNKPLLNTPVTITLIFKSMTYGPNTTAKIELSDGFELVSGNLNWNGDLSPNEEQKIEAIVKSTKIGYYKLKGSAISRQGEDSYFGDADIINVEITSTDAIMGSKPENNWESSMALPIAQNNGQLKSELIIFPTPELNKEITVVYRVISLIDIPDPQGTQISLIIPPKGFEVLDVKFPQDGENYEGKVSDALKQFSWKGAISRDQPVEIKVILKITDTGWGNIYGHSSLYSGIENIDDAKIAYLYVDKYKGNFTILEV